MVICYGTQIVKGCQVRDETPWDPTDLYVEAADSRSQELAKMSDEILKEPKPREEPKEIHLDEKDEKEDATRDKLDPKSKSVYLFLDKFGYKLIQSVDDIVAKSCMVQF